MEGNKDVVIRTNYDELNGRLMSNSFYRGERLKLAGEDLPLMQASNDDSDILRDAMFAAENDVTAILTLNLGKVFIILRDAAESITVNGVEHLRKPELDKDNLYAFGNYYTYNESPSVGDELFEADGTASESSISNIGKKGTTIKLRAMSNFDSEYALNVAVQEYVAERMLAAWLEIVYPTEAAAAIARASEKIAVLESVANKREKPKRVY